VELQFSLKDLVSEDVYNLDVNRWLSRYEDDCDVSREIAIAKPGVQPLPSKIEAVLINFLHHQILDI